MPSFHTSRPFLMALLLSMTTVLPALAIADTLKIPGHFAQSTSDLPKRGLKMDQVLDRYGEPLERKPTVGQPPITEWEYENFRVYFEYDTVLHSLDLTTLVMPN